MTALVASTHMRGKHTLHAKTSTRPTDPTQQRVLSFTPDAKRSVHSGAAYVSAAVLIRLFPNKDYYSSHWGGFHPRAWANNIFIHMSIGAGSRQLIYLLIVFFPPSGGCTLGVSASRFCLSSKEGRECSSDKCVCHTCCQWDKGTDSTSDVDSCCAWKIFPLCPRPPLFVSVV